MGEKATTRGFEQGEASETGKSKNTQSTILKIDSPCLKNKPRQKPV